jgi:hypothetical protein
MNITLYDDYDFQKLMGYLDDPEPMSATEAHEEMQRYGRLLGVLLDNFDGDCETFNALAFAHNLLIKSAVSYTHPFAKYEYRVGFEYNDILTVRAESQNIADEIAESHFHALKDTMPPTCGAFRLTYSYVERADDSCNRIYEE